MLTAGEPVLRPPVGHPGARWPLARAGARARLVAEHARRHPALLDVAIAAFTAALAIAIDVGAQHREVLGAVVVWDLALAVPLVLRRQRPSMTFGLVASLCLVQWLAGVRAQGDIAIFFALYALGAYERRWRMLAAAVVVAEIGVGMATSRWGLPSERLQTAVMLTGTVTASWVVGIYLRVRRAYVGSMVERAQAAERDRDTRAQIAVGEERARIAREMHDVIAHSLSVMITLNDAAAAVDEPERSRATVIQASEVGRQALTDMQRMLGVLRSDDAAEVIPQPGVAQLPDLVARVRSAGLEVSLSTSGRLQTLAPTAQLAMYRIVQESLTNILKHGRNVCKVSIAASLDGTRLALQVDNDGDIVPARGGAQPGPLRGHGLTGMAERAALFGGTVTALPMSGGGWRVRTTLELDARGARL